MTEHIASIGHNNAPDPIDIALAPFADILMEAENWLDGAVIENDAQLKATDALLKELKAARKAVDNARDDVTKPLHDMWKAEIARWKPTQDDLDRQVKCMIALQSPYKAAVLAKQNAEKAEIERIAREKADAARLAHKEANSGDIRAARCVDDMQREAEQAAMQLAKAERETVKGMRTVHRFTIDDHRAALNWIARNDRDSLTAFVESYVAKTFKLRAIDGVNVTTEKEAF